MKTIIVIPIYKNKPTKSEIASLLQCTKILNNFDFCFVTHENLDFSEYKIINKHKSDYKFEFFEPENFLSVQSYSALCLDAKFYKRFANYDYMLIYQLDGWIFKDALDFWCNQNFDYIGAPWFEGYDRADNDSKLICPSGNGGISLRKIDKFVKITEKLAKSKFLRKSSFEECLDMVNKKGLHKYYCALKMYLKKGNSIATIKNLNEDFAIVRYFNRFDSTFKIAPPEVAMNFSFEALPERLYKMSGNNLPFACHAWEKFGKDFYKRFINIDTPFSY